MPIYEYDCDDCGLRFDKLVPMRDADVIPPCKECSSFRVRKLVSAVSFTFAHAPVGGPRPQNTGVHGIDYNIDRVIGRDAEQKWKLIEERNSRKASILRDNPGSRTRDLAKTPDGDYAVLKGSARDYVESRRKVADAALPPTPKPKP